MEKYLQMMAWWNSKTDEQKFAYVGIDTINKWVEGVIREETLNAEVPAPIPANSVTKLLSK